MRIWIECGVEGCSATGQEVDRQGGISGHGQGKVGVAITTIVIC